MLMGMKMPHRSLRVLSYFALGATLALGAAACSGTAHEAAPANVQSGLSLAPVGQNTHGPVRMVGQALGEVPLRPDQRTELEKLATQAEERHVKVHEQAKSLMLAFADQVEKGQIDRAALKPKIDATVAAFEASRPADRAALERTHDILDASQRDKFVEALKAKMKDHHGHHGPPHAKGGPEGEAAPPKGEAKPEGAPHHGPPMGLFHLGRELKLTDDQKDKIKDVFKESWRENMKEHHGGKHAGGPWGGHHKGGKHALEAFREDKLDLDKVAPPQDLKAMANGGVEHVAKIAEKVLPILTPEQRKIAADKLREMANGGDTSLLVH